MKQDFADMHRFGKKGSKYAELTNSGADDIGLNSTKHLSKKSTIVISRGFILRVNKTVGVLSVTKS